MQCVYLETGSTASYRSPWQSVEIYSQGLQSAVPVGRALSVLPHQSLCFTTSGEERELRLNQASFERAAALLRRVPEFTIAAALRQEQANSGTIVAFSHGSNRYEIPKSSLLPARPSLLRPSTTPHGNSALDGRNEGRRESLCDLFRTLFE